MMEKEDLKGLQEQTITSRIVSSLINGVFLFILNLLIVLFVCFPILKNIPSYKENNENTFNEVYNMYRLEEDAKLNYLKEGSTKEIISELDYFSIWLNKTLDNSKKYNDSIDLETIELAKEDELAYYFVYFKSENKINLESYNNLEPLEYYQDLFFDYFNQKYFLTRDNIDIPLIKSDYIEELSNSLNNNTNSDIFNEIYNSFIEIHQIALNDFTNYEVYQTHYNSYLNSYKIISNLGVASLVITFIIIYILYILIPSLIVRYNVTLGEIITKTRRITSSDTWINYKQGFVINLLYLIEIFFIVIIISFFTFGLSSLVFPLFYIGSLGITSLHFFLLSFILMIINTAFSAFRSDHLSLIDLLSKTKQISMKNYIKPIDEDEINNK